MIALRKVRCSSRHERVRTAAYVDPMNRTRAMAECVFIVDFDDDPDGFVGNATLYVYSVDGSPAERHDIGAPDIRYATYAEALERANEALAAHDMSITELP